jgi:hypothetical protein
MVITLFRRGFVFLLVHRWWKVGGSVGPDILEARNKTYIGGSL